MMITLPPPLEGEGELGWLVSTQLLNAVADEVNAHDEGNVSWEQVDDVIKSLVARGYCIPPNPMTPSQTTIAAAERILERLSVFTSPDDRPATAAIIQAAIDAEAGPLRDACQRALYSFKGCDCECLKEDRDEDGNIVPAHTCLPCQLKAVLKAALTNTERKKRR